MRRRLKPPTAVAERGVGRRRYAFLEEQSSHQMLKFLKSLLLGFTSTAALTNSGQSQIPIETRRLKEFYPDLEWRTPQNPLHVRQFISAALRASESKGIFHESSRPRDDGRRYLHSISLVYDGSPNGTCAESHGTQEPQMDSRFADLDRPIRWSSCRRYSDAATRT